VTEISSPDYQERDAVAMRAYEIWQRRGCPQGTAMQDWLEAEAELRHERRARLEATRLFEPPAPMEIGPAEALVPTPVLAADGSPAEPPAKRRRRAPGAASVKKTASAAANLAATTSSGTRVARKRPARPDA